MSRSLDYACGALSTALGMTLLEMTDPDTKLKYEHDMMTEKDYIYRNTCDAKPPPYFTFIIIY